MDQLPPNVLFVFADQLRRMSLGFGGDRNIHTPVFDQFARGSVDFVHAVSGYPVCSPARASLLTALAPHRHGVFLNDVPLSRDLPTVGEVFRDAGYRTGYIGKWHLCGRGRQACVPPEDRHGFDFWCANECSHDYQASRYYRNLDPTPYFWPGYDAAAQTEEAIRFMRTQKLDPGSPFFLMLSWGPPHNPYDTAPQRFRDSINAAKLILPTNIPPEFHNEARTDLAGYYAHILALDELFGQILQALSASGLDRNTIVVFWSDHGDMLYSQGQVRKQRPWEEAIRVPLLIRCPPSMAVQSRRLLDPIGTEDIMPTILGLCGLRFPRKVHGMDYAPSLQANAPSPRHPVQLSCCQPFGEFTREMGGREYRGIRTEQYTYVRDLNGPWLLYDNQADPLQQKNLCGHERNLQLQQQLDGLLQTELQRTGDEFLPGEEYVRRSGLQVDATGGQPVRDYF